MEEGMTQAFTIAFTGMGIVFSFLTILVLVLMCLAKCLALFPEPQVEPQGVAPQENKEALLRKVAAIAVSIHRKRKDS